MPDEATKRFYHDRSMAGTFSPGNYLTVVPVSLAEVRPGDVMVYRRQDRREDADELVHRIVAATYRTLSCTSFRQP